MRPLQHIAQSEGKHTTIPQRTLFDIFFCHFLSRFLLKHRNPAYCFLAKRNDVAIFLTRIRRLNPHQNKIRITFLCSLAQCLQCLKIVILHIRIHWADNHRFLLSDSLHILQISCCKCNCRKGVTAARLHTDSHVLPKLVMDCRYLRL